MKSASVLIVFVLSQLTPRPVCAIAKWTAPSHQSPSQTEGPSGDQSSAAKPAAAQPKTTAPAQTVPAPKKSSSSAKHKKPRHKPAGSATQKVVVKNGSAPDPGVQFSTTGSQAQASHEREKTDGLLSSTTANLQKVPGRQLSKNQEDMKTQIDSYMAQAKAAEQAGDYQSAYNLALKANLLSKDLIGK